MKFKSKFNFVMTLAIQPMSEFNVVPVKETRDDNKENIVVHCDPKEAQAFAIYAKTPNAGREWIADFQKEEEAVEFMSILTTIYKSGKKSRPELLCVQTEKTIIGAIEEGDNLQERLTTILTKHFDGEITHISGGEENKNGQRIFDAIIRETIETNLIFQGKVTLTPIPIFPSEG